MAAYKRSDPKKLAKERAEIAKAQQPSLWELVVRTVEGRRERRKLRSFGYTGSNPQREGAQETTMPSSLEGAVTGYRKRRRTET
jgi:hypothetical protein